MIAYPWRSSPARASRMWKVAGGSGSRSSTESGSFRMPYYSHSGYIVNAYSARRGACGIDPYIVGTVAFPVVMAGVVLGAWASQATTPWSRGGYLWRFGVALIVV